MPHNSTRGEALLREFANNDLSPDALRQRASILLSSKDLVRNAMGLTPEERARLIDKFDQVRWLTCPFPRKSLIRYFCEGISHYRLAKCENFDRLGKPM